MRVQSVALKDHEQSARSRAQQDSVISWRYVMHAEICDVSRNSYCLGRRRLTYVGVEPPESGNNLLLLLFLLLIISAVPLWHPKAPLVVDLAPVNTVDSISKRKDVGRVRDLMDLSVVLDLSDGDDHNTGSTTEHTASC